ncbi:MAG: hypothetical protein A2Z96_05190 [Spirochaetes bacterium GWB1_48_6]|nr:MAG: hypothetical protein A2Z96_05190 [Spirochaetes bacterium GWB1_48_6]
MNRLDLYPQVRNLRLTSSKVVEGIYSGNYRSVFKGPGLEFDEVREYSPTDDSRFIDWNVTSRLGTPYTKIFREERELQLQMVVDLSPSLYAGNGPMSKRDILNILFANLTFAAVSNNDKVGAIFHTDRIEGWVGPRKGRNHATRLIQDCLTLDTQGQGSDLSLALRTVHESMKHRGIIIILSDFRTTGYWQELSILSRKHDIICLMITDPLDDYFPRTGWLELQDPETGQVLHAFGESSNFQQVYHDKWTLHKLHWRRECRRRGIETLEVSTVDDPAARLVAFFNRRKARR